MRELKFRGKRIDNNEWIYGYYVKTPMESRIYWQPFASATMNTYHIVSPETVGQFTGLKDKNGNEIFEGNILCSNGQMSVVKYNEDIASFTGLQFVKQKFNSAGTQIIGNIHDNPELLNR